MRQFTAVLETGFAGAKHEEKFEMDDSATDEEIQAEAYQQVIQYIDIYYVETKKSDSTAK